MISFIVAPFHHRLMRISISISHQLIGNYNSLQQYYLIYVIQKSRFDETYLPCRNQFGFLPLSSWKNHSFNWCIYQLANSCMRIFLIQRHFFSAVKAELPNNFVSISILRSFQSSITSSFRTTTISLSLSFFHFHFFVCDAVVSHQLPY